jgi:type IV secretion system protein VirD4
MKCDRLTAGLLKIALAAGAYCLAVVGIVAWPSSGVLLVILVLGRALRGGGKHLTTLGSARWANESELRAAGMIGGDSGLILGRLQPSERSSVVSNAGLLLKRNVRASDACRGVLMPRGKGDHQWVRLPQAVHTAVFSPSGGGKGVSCILPFLMTCPDSCVVIDFKSENAKITAEHRRRQFGHRVIELDPFGIMSRKPDRFNALDFIDKSSSYALDECNDLAKAIVVRTGNEKEPHWDDSAEAWIAALIATVVQYGDLGETRSLQTLRDMLTQPQRLDMAIKVMLESDAWGGMLARMGGQLMHFVEKERASVLTTASRHLRFLDTLAVAESTKSSSFDPAELRNGKMTVYLILPPEHMRAQSALLRVWIGAMLRAIVKGGLQETNKVHFILDEAASLGRMEAVEDAIDKYRGYGVRLQFYYQSPGQLKKCFPEDEGRTLLSNATQLFFGVNDNETAEYVSSRLGEHTVIVDSGGTSSGTSHQATQSVQGSTSQGGSYNASRNWGQQARRLLKPEEVMTLPGRTAITFAPGVPPVKTTLIRHYEEKSLGRRRSRIQTAWESVSMLITAAFLCACALGAAAVLTLVAVDHAAPVSTAPVWTQTWGGDR